MARQNINIGTVANDGTGDDLRVAMQKVNDNFTELYASSIYDDGIAISGNNISGTRSNEDINIVPSGTGAVTFPAVTINDNLIQGSRSNEDLYLSTSGTGNIIIEGIRVNGTTLSADDSTKITLNEAVDITGTLTVGTIANGGSTVEILNIDTNSISSSDSSAVQILDDLNVEGNINTQSLIVNDDVLRIRRSWDDDSTRSTSVGKTGDRAGMITWGDDYVYVCVAEYDGSTQIWKRAALSTF